MKQTITAVVVAAFLVACAGTPGPGDPGYLFNVSGPYTGQFSVSGQALPATLELETRPGGAVEGAFAVAAMGIEGSVEGELAADTLRLVGNYYNPESGCDGVVSMQATVTENGDAFRGELEATECGTYLTGTLRFSR